jgi:hypothetical protein
MSFMRLTVAYLVLLAIAATTTACSSADSSRAGRSTSTSATSDGAMPYSTWQPTPHASYKAAGISGTLALDSNGCVRLCGADGSLIVLLWPVGYVSRTVGAVVEVVSPRGTTVAKIGDAFSAGGGYVARAPAGQRCAPTSGGWEINQDLPT